MARRVNTRFLIILTAIVLVGGVSAVVIKKVFFRGNPDAYVNTANEYLAKGDYDEAVRNYTNAIALDSENPERLVAFGDFLSNLAWYDDEYIGRSRAAWEKAVEVDPHYVPALERLLNFWESYAKFQQLPDIFQQIRNAAQKLMDADPQNTHAKVAYHSAVLRSWQSGVATDRAAIDEHVSAMAALLEQDPTNPDLPAYIAEAKIADAQDALRQNDRATASKLFAEADALIENSLKAAPDSAMAQYHASQVFSSLALSDRDPQNPDLYKVKYLPRIKAAMEKAVTLIKPQDENYIEVRLRAATFAAQDGRQEEAEKIYKDLLAERHDDPVVRLAYSKYLAATKHRPEAIALLAEPVEQLKSYTGLRALMIRNLRMQTLLDLSNLRLDQYVQTSDPAERQRTMAQVDESYSKLFAELGEVPDTLKLKGKIELLKGENVEAIQTLDKARQLLEQLGRPADYDLLFMLARGYVATQQTGAAKSSLEKIVKEYPNFLPAKMLMAQCLIREGDKEGAKPYVEELEKALPDEAEVVRMRLALLDRQKDTAEIDRYYHRLPEDTRDDKIQKAQIAAMVGNLNEAVRLLSLMLQEDAGDKQASLALANIYATRSQKSEALEVLAKARKLDPQDPSLELAETQIRGASSEEIGEKVDRMIDQETDPFMKEMKLAELARRQDKPDEMMAHLKKAESINANDPRVMQQLFDAYLGDKKFAEAGVYAEKLGRANIDQANGLLYRYRIAAARGELSNALSIARDLAKAMPEFSRSYSTLGQAFQATGQNEDALRNFAIALEKQPTNIDALKGIISAYYAINQPGQALEYINKGRSIYPDDPEFQRFAVEHSLNYGDPEEAVEPLEKALRQKSNSPQAYAAVGSAYLKVARKKAESDPKMSSSFLSKANDTFSQAMRKWPDEPAFYGYLAEISLLTGDFDRGENILKQLQARDAWKDRPEPLMALSDFYSSAGKFDLAEASLRDALGKSKSPDVVRVELAKLLSNPRVRKYDDALKELDAISGSADDPKIQRQRIEILLTANRLDDAEKNVQAALKKSPDSADLLNLLAIVNVSARKYEQAVPPLLRVLELDPKNFTALYHLGMVRLQQPRQDLEEAIKYLQQARDVYPRSPDTRLTLADAYRQHNDPDAAVAELESALEVSPQHSGVRLMLLDLYSGSYLPPRWGDYERVVKAAEQMPEYANDPQWLEREAQMWQRRGDNAQAVAKMQAALKLAPENPALLNAYLGMLADTKNYRQLKSEAEQLMAKNSQAWWIYSARAIARANLQDRGGALEDFNAALELARNSGSDAVTENIIRTMTREVGVKEAIAYVEKQASSDPRWRLLLVVLYRADNNDAAAIQNLELLRRDFDKLSPAQLVNALRLEGTIYLTAKPPQADKAERAYRELLAKNPDDFTALNNLAYLLAENVNPPRPQDALEFSQHAYDLMRKRGTLEPLIADTHGWILTLLDRPEGLGVLEEVVQRAPFVEAHYHLAEAYLKRQYATEAQQQLQLADDLVQQAQKKDQPVDPAMVAKINDAMNRAQEMVRSKSQAQVP